MAFEHVIAIAGMSGSGKTTIGRHLAECTGRQFVSFGDYFRNLAKENNLPWDKASLQKLGQQSIEEHLNITCVSVLEVGGWPQTNRLVVDGVRHVHVFNHLSGIIGKRQLRLIFCETPEAVRFDRLQGRDGLTTDQIDKIDSHIVERASRAELRALSDLVVDGSRDLSAIIEEICHYIQST